MTKEYKDEGMRILLYSFSLTFTNNLFLISEIIYFVVSMKFLHIADEDLGL